MALMGSDRARLGQNEQALAVLEWLSSEGAQNLLRQVSADRAQRADEPDIQRGREEQQRRRDTAVHDWLNTPEAQRFLMGREDADIAMRQQGQRLGPGSVAGPQPQPPEQRGPSQQDRMRQATSGYGQMGDPRAQMMEGLMAAGAANPDFDRSGGGAEFVGRWPQNASGSRFVGGPPNTQRTDPGGAAFQGFMDPRNEYAGSGSRFQSPPYPDPDFFGIPPRPQPGPRYGPPR